MRHAVLAGKCDAEGYINPDEFRAAGGYMHVVARVHVARLERR